MFCEWQSFTIHSLRGSGCCLPKIGPYYAPWQERWHRGAWDLPLKAWRLTLFTAFWSGFWLRQEAKEQFQTMRASYEVQRIVLAADPDLWYCIDTVLQYYLRLSPEYVCDRSWRSNLNREKLERLKVLKRQGASVASAAFSRLHLAWLLSQDAPPSPESTPEDENDAQNETPKEDPEVPAPDAENTEVRNDFKNDKTTRAQKARQNKTTPRNNGLAGSEASSGFKR